MLRSIHDFLVRIINFLIKFLTTRPAEDKPAPDVQTENMVWVNVNETPIGWKEVGDVNFVPINNVYDIIGMTDCALYQPYQANRGLKQNWSFSGKNSINFYSGVGITREYESPQTVRSISASFKHRNFMNSKAWIIGKDKDGQLVGLAYVYAPSTSTRQTFSIAWNGVKELRSVYVLMVSAAVISGTGNSDRIITHTKIE